jgi:hypothetical protein
MREIASSKIIVITQILFIAMTVTQIRLFERHCDEPEVKRRMKKPVCERQAI